MCMYGRLYPLISRNTEDTETEKHQNTSKILK